MLTHVWKTVAFSAIGLPWFPEAQRAGQDTRQVSRRARLREADRDQHREFRTTLSLKRASEQGNYTTTDKPTVHAAAPHLAAPQKITLHRGEELAVCLYLAKRKKGQTPELTAISANNPDSDMAVIVLQSPTFALPVDTGGGYNGSGSAINHHR